MHLYDNLLEFLEKHFILFTTLRFVALISIYDLFVTVYITRRVYRKIKFKTLN